jgi:hypothetical protein
MASLLRLVSVWATRAPSLAFSRKNSAWRQRPDILKLILGKGLLLAGTGIAIGLFLSAISAPVIAVWRSPD